MIKRFLLGLFASAALVSAADAACSGTGGVPFGCDAAQAAPGATDVILGGTSGSTVKYTAQQMATGIFSLVPQISGGNASNLLHADGTWGPVTGSLNGANVLLGTNGSGKIDPSTLPIATTNALGAFKPDNVTVITDPVTGITSVQGGVASAVSAGTTTITGGTPGTLVVNAAGKIGNVLALPAANAPAFTGDVTNTAGSLALSLATVNSGPGSVGGASLIPVFTTDGKGRVIAQSTVDVVAPAGTLTGSTLASGITSAPGITSLGTLTGLTVAGTANTVGVVDTTTATANTYGMSSTSGIRLGGTIGAPATNGNVLDQEISYIENAAIGSPPNTGAVRMRYLFDTIAGNVAGTSGTDEGMFLGRRMASGTFTSEVNGYHGYIQLDAGTSITSQAESFECSNLINGTAATISCYLALSVNGANGTTNNMIGLKAQLSNANATSAAVGEYDAFLVAPASGGGSAPTHNFAFKNQDATATIDTIGNVVIGQTRDAATNEMLHIFSVINAGHTTNDTFGLIVTGTAGNLLAVRDNGSVAMVGPLQLTAITGSTQCLQVSTTGVISGTGAACGSSGGSGTVTSVVAGAGLTGGTITTTGTIALDVTNANTWTGTQIIKGPDTGSTIPFKIADSANTILFSMQDNGNASMNNSLTVGTSGSVNGALTILTSAGGSAKLLANGLAAASSLFIPTNVGASDTIALLGTNETFSASSIVFSGTVNFTGTLKGGGNTGVTCATGAPTASFSTTNGVVTHC